MIEKIISGAQTGADQAGLTAAVELGLQTGGWIPKGRRTWIGPLSEEKFMMWNLTEHSSSSYPPRTQKNVEDSDGTVLFGGMNSPGCKLTISICKSRSKPFLCNPSPNDLKHWIKFYKIKTLNVAGNREEKNPGIFQHTRKTLILAIEPLLRKEENC